MACATYLVLVLVRVPIQAWLVLLAVTLGTVDAAATASAAAVGTTPTASGSLDMQHLPELALQYNHFLPGSLAWSAWNQSDHNNSIKVPGLANAP